ncbi:MAG: flagellar export protein FliJ [Lachnospiraceae bacterium]|nr:flagellar export protein FliJ [Ruminococcus sp.]MCM1273836.1 flagellar export protein FliJ [Lachnospiraceae bacterium]
MKRFQFSLQKLMDFREQELDRQKNTLSMLQAELSRIREAREVLLDKVDEQSEQLERVCRLGSSASDIAMRKRYIVTLQQEIHLKEQQALQKQQEIEQQLGVVVEATKDVKTLEKLEEKQLEEYNHQAGKENEQFIEEFVSGQTVRAANQ